MKNFQQTPKARRILVAKAKTQLAHSKPVFQPREAWATKLKLGGVFQSTLDDKQIGAAHPGVARDWWPHFNW